MSSVTLPAIQISYVPPQTPHGEGTLARISFGFDEPHAVNVGMQQLGPRPLVEHWQSNGDDLLFGSLSLEESGRLENLSREAYKELIDHVRASGFPYFVRLWNYVGGINEEDERERYQLFCAGRHDAYVEKGYHHDVDLPAASAVGMKGRGLIVCFLASREPGVQVENPRQVAAYHYPEQYGPKSPSFSRATVWRDTVFVSGTSSVVGHETVHQDDVLAQLEETLRNIEVVLRSTNRSLEQVLAARTYIRRPADFAAIAERLDRVFSSNLYLEADICRKDLLLEIEVVAR